MGLLNNDARVGNMVSEFNEGSMNLRLITENIVATSLTMLVPMGVGLVRQGQRV